MKENTFSLPPQEREIKKEDYIVKKFWKATLIRAVRTMAESAIAYIGSAALVSEVNWLGALSAAAMGGVMSVLLAVATGLPEAE